ncbi:hypothetical protein [Ligilactobacillus aviarius]|uniref:hypothetical protein n=1 Tax=Ligilactobacillus aviarius TaxID=1606 RepID=UPI0024BB4360|nr:hypothetical protein [Ligilactobacillus aviarius]
MKITDSVLGIAKTSLFPYSKHLSSLDVCFGDFILQVIVPNGLEVVKPNDLIVFNELGWGQNRECYAIGYRKIRRSDGNE